MGIKTFSVIIAAICVVFMIAMVVTCIPSTTAAAPADIGNGVERIVDMTDDGSKYELTPEEFDLISRIVSLEVGGEDEKLQRTVTEVIYNRVVSGIWGDSVEKTIYAKNQFSVVPLLDTANPSELTKSIVKDVFDNGSTIPKRIMFFRANHYHRWYGAVDEFALGNVYFSSSKWYQE